MTLTRQLAENIVAERDKWIGGSLCDFYHQKYPSNHIIKDVRLTDGYFEVEIETGDSFGLNVDVEYGSLDLRGESVKLSCHGCADLVFYPRANALP